MSQLASLPDTREIALTNGGVAIVDADCFDWLNQWNWRFHHRDHPYVVRFAGVGGKKSATVYMHRVVAGAGGGEMVDHVNRDPLDNRRCNLRICTASGNAINRAFPVSKSGYRGVHKHHSHWRANISFQNVVHRLGHFSTPEAAARAYDEAAIRLHGEFAVLNFPEAQ